VKREAASVSSVIAIRPSTITCSRRKQARHAVAASYLDASCLVWSTHRVSDRCARACLEDLDTLSREIEVFRGHPDFVAADAPVDGVRGRTRSDLLHSEGKPWKK
jgi:hypothetical protein